MNWRILTGDVRERLRDLDAGSVQTCVTSPPYWGLRDYGTAEWEGGDPACSHMRGIRASDKSRLNGGRGQLEYERSETQPYVGDCGKCGARRIDSQIGLEPTPDAYVQQMVGVFREVRRVLKDDGTVWLNLGDNYAANGPGGDQKAGLRRAQFGVAYGQQVEAEAAKLQRQKDRRVPVGLKPKDLVGIPWRVAFALQADGWYLRSDIIWSKPNPMPESVTDRPTKAHEYIFLLSKRASYYYDAEAIKEANSETSQMGGVYRQDGKTRRLMRGGEGNDGIHAIGTVNIWLGRNKRSVWHVATQPYPEAHFATFPEALIEPCVLAGSRLGDTVLDPFCGSGTTGAVAIRHQRNFIGVELNPAYVQLAQARIGGEAPLFAEELRDGGSDAAIQRELWEDPAMTTRWRD